MVYSFYTTALLIFFSIPGRPTFTEDIPDDVAIAPNRFLVQSHLKIDGGHGQIPEIQDLTNGPPLTKLLELLDTKV